MSYLDYLKEVTFNDGATTYTVPIWDLDIKIVPWHGSGSINVEYFHGEMAHRIHGWKLEASFKLNFGHDGTDDGVWTDLLNDISAGTVWTIDFDPDTPGVKTGTFILGDSGIVQAAQFSGHIRNRPMATKWVGTQILDTVPTWIVCDTEAFSLLDADDILFFDGLMVPPEVDGSGFVTKWENQGTLGATGDLTAIPSWASTRPKTNTDANVGEAIQFLNTADGLATAAAGILATAGTAGADAGASTYDSEIWMLYKTATKYCRLMEFSNGGGGNACRWSLLDATGDEIVISYQGSTLFASEVTGFSDNAWHIVRIIFNNSVNNQILEIDGYPLNGASSSSGIDPSSNYYFGIGDGDDIYGAPFPAGQIGLVKMTNGLRDTARQKAIYAYLRDTLGVTNIPADATATVAIWGAFSQENIMRVATIGAGTSYSTVYNGSSGEGRCLENDRTNEWVYYGDQSGRLWRIDYSGANRVILTNSGLGSHTYGISKDVAGDELIWTAGSNGNEMGYHSADPADWLTIYTQIISPGTYEMYGAVEWNPNDSLIYFIDSLAATPALRTITKAGTGDTSLKSLTAGKVYTFMELDETNNVLYFVNETDKTIEKYDIGTGTHSVIHTATNAPRDIDLYESGQKLWYMESVSGLIYEVDLTSPSGKTQVADVSAFPTTYYGLAMIVFDTTT